LKDIGEEVAKIQNLYSTAVYERNVASFVRLYDPKVRVFDAWGLWQYNDIDAWQVAVEGWFSALGQGRVKVLFQETNILGTTDLANVSAIVTYTEISAEGSVTKVMQNRITWAVKTSSHNLRIIHEHSSAPIGFEDMKAILNR
jgi:ketosteroid isomerase-like protein